MNTFEELGLKFTKEAECVTCQDLSCHNNVPLKTDGREYNVHISMNEEKTEFTVHATENASVDSTDDIYQEFTAESDAVKFLCDTFDGFKCV